MKNNSNKAKKTLIDKLKILSTTSRSKLAKDIKFRIENQKWLDYSAQIAMRISAVIEDKEGFNQVSLAETLKISPQQVSKILKGEQNLTLKTIGNLSAALNEELISFPLYKDSYVSLTKGFSLQENSNLSDEYFKYIFNLLKSKPRAEITNATVQKDEAIVINPYKGDAKLVS